MINSIENKQTTAGIFVDLSKAFDTLDHTILLHKIQKLGIRGIAYTWIKNYLTNRFQTVRLYKHNSNDYMLSDLNRVTHGVPQGSILGPLLFIIYINDINSSITNGHLFSYADDTTILVEGPTIEDVYIHTHENLINLIDWLNANKLSVNLSKTNYIIFTPNQQRYFVGNDNTELIINNTKIEKVNSTNFLGLIIDSKLSWEYQVNNICNKVNQGFYIIDTLKNLVPDRIKKSPVLCTCISTSYKSQYSMGAHAECNIYQENLYHTR